MTGYHRMGAFATYRKGSLFQMFRDIRRPEAVFETYAAMRCEK